MKQHSVRMGFANNSSSTHSIIMLKKLNRARLNIGDIVDVTSATEEYMDSDHAYFGWENFVCTSKQLKRNYLYALVLDNIKISLVRNGGYQYRDAISTELVAREFSDIFNDATLTPEFINDANIDHQSLLMLPVNYGNRKKLDRAFLGEFRDWIDNDCVIIKGGNDNEEPDDAFFNGLQSDDLTLNVVDLKKVYDNNYVYFERFYAPPKNYRDLSDRECYLVSRQDYDIPTNNSYWTLFNTLNGDKLRLSFNDIDPPKKSNRPELIDVKITDYCPFNCEYCYMGSTAKGVHADYDTIKELAKLLGKDGLQVFEVALGGGEPTLHPRFSDIVRTFYAEGICVNFTTRNLAWMNDPVICDVVNKFCGDFAFSFDSVKDLQRLEEAVSTSLLDKEKVDITVQYVMGTANKEEFINILNYLTERRPKIQFKLTLLGYKTTGRGLNVLPIDYSDWFKLIEDRYQYVGIDTVLACQWKENLEISRVPNIFYETEEGKFSCYIDLVNLRMGPCSYTDNYDKLELPLKLDDIQANFINY